MPARTYRLTGAWNVSRDPATGVLVVEADSCEDVTDLDFPAVHAVERTDATDARPALAVGELSRTDGGGT